jgi:hypothetical protein
LRDFALFRWEDAHMTDDLPRQTEEGKVLQAMLQADGRSVRQVAPLAGLSEARWRQIVKGSMTANGRNVEVVAPPATLARMAYVLNIPPKILRGLKRDDAAEVLEHLLFEAKRGSSVVPLPVTSPSGMAPDEIDLIYASRTMTPKQKLEAIRKVLQLRALVEAADEPPPAGAESTPAESQDAG